MHSMAHDPSMDLARPREGQVDVWVRVVVTLAVVCTLVVLFAAPRLVWMRGRHELGFSLFWFHNALGLAASAVLVLACVWPGRSRFVRLAIVLPILHAFAMIAAAIAWALLADRMPLAQDTAPLLERIPIRIVLPWFAIATGFGGWLVARTHRREALHGIVMFALAHLLTLGLWLPLASTVWNGRGFIAWQQIQHALDAPANVFVFVVVPPFVAAITFTASALRHPLLWRRATKVIGAGLVLALGIGIVLRSQVTEIGAFLYVNFVHVLAAVGFIAVAGLAALAVATWIGTARARAVVERPDAVIGVITSTHPIARVEVTSWLRGLRQICDGFVVETVLGELPVPPGARVVSPVPLASTLLRRGEVIQTLKPGDRIALTGFVHVKRDDLPHRASIAPIPGADGITVGRIGDERPSFAHVGLELWRPAVAYLIILVAVTLPAFAALLSKKF